MSDIAKFFSSDGNNQEFIFLSLLNEFSFIDLVKVIDVKGKLLTVKSMLCHSYDNGKRIENEPIYGIPFLQLRRGNSAVVMDPAPGDIGLMAVCDKDISAVKESGADGVPPTDRRHGKTDGIYLTGIASLNVEPEQYVHFTDSGINIKSPGSVNINGLKILPDGRLQLTNGVIVDTHIHGGVESGGSESGGPR